MKILKPNTGIIPVRTMLMMVLIIIFLSSCQKDIDESINYRIESQANIPPPPHNIPDWTPHNLSVARGGLAGAAAANKIVFAGGYGNSRSSRVDIYNTTMNAWSTAELSQARSSLAGAAAGSKIAFAGGDGFPTEFFSTRVDIYDAAANTWTTAALSAGRDQLAGAGIGNKIIFAGGRHRGPQPEITIYSKVADIYDVTNNTWSTAQLNDGRSNLAGTASGNKIFFAGGFNGDHYSSIVDVYNVTTNTWSIANLSQPRSSLAAAAAGDKVVFAGGEYYHSLLKKYFRSTRVDIYNMSTNSWSTAQLSEGRSGLTAAAVGNKIFFAGGNENTNKTSKVVDIYNVVTNTWTTDELSEARRYPASAGTGRKLLVAGGSDNAYSSNRIDAFIFSDLTAHPVFGF